MLIAFLIQSVALVSVMALGPLSPAFFVISMALVFFTWGEVYVLFPSALADFFGGKNASANYSFLYSTKGVASILAGGLAAQLFESSGSWGPAFYGSAVLALISAGMAVGLMKLPLPSKQEQPATEPLTVGQRWGAAFPPVASSFPFCIFPLPLPLLSFSPPPSPPPPFSSSLSLLPSSFFSFRRPGHLFLPYRLGPHGCSDADRRPARMDLREERKTAST